MEELQAGSMTIAIDDHYGDAGSIACVGWAQTGKHWAVSA